MINQTPKTKKTRKIVDKIKKNKKINGKKIKFIGHKNRRTKPSIRKTKNGDFFVKKNLQNHTSKTEKKNTDFRPQIRMYFFKFFLK